MSGRRPVPTSPEVVREAPDPIGMLLLLLAAPLSVVAWAGMLGLGVGRQGAAGAVAITSTLAVYGPALAVGATTPAHKLRRVAATLLLWAGGLLLAMPVYFPGERREAVTTGLSLLTGDLEGGGVPRRVADALPDEPALAVAQVPQAEPHPEESFPPGPPPGQADIELPYEGEGRRLSIDVTFEHQGRIAEGLHMMLDTGATYTTLPLSVLRDVLGVAPGPDAPELTLNTANGQRTAKVVLLDRVWLGDKALEGVAITTCEDCAADDNAGLLGLNVTGAFNLRIDADRHLVVFTERARFNRRLDVRPFSDLQGKFVRYPGGRVEVEMNLENRSPREILDATAKVTCGASEWAVALGAVAPFAEAGIRRRLPAHERCPSYEIVLEDAAW